LGSVRYFYVFERNAHQGSIFVVVVVVFVVVFDPKHIKTILFKILLQFEITVLKYIKNIYFGGNAEFSASLLQSSVAHDASKIILMR